MSNPDPAPAERPRPVAADPRQPTVDLLDGRDVPLGKHTIVRRTLPTKTRRTVGAWCFLDHFGPQDVYNMPGMRVPPHPHIGLQTVTWLLEGEVLHRDSLGSVQTIHPGELNLMTAGHGIAHSEESPVDRPPTMHGVQLWLALPERERHGDARFEHHADLPTVTVDDAVVRLAVGELLGERSPARVHSPLVGAELTLPAGGRVRVPVRPTFEHAVVVMQGALTAAGVAVAPGSLLYLGTDRDEVRLESTSGARAFLVGGEPLREDLVMWWNFVGRSHEDIVAARTAWEAGERFGEVRGYPYGDRLPAPALPTTRLLPRPNRG